MKDWGVGELESRRVRKTESPEVRRLGAGTRKDGKLESWEVGELKSSKEQGKSY